MSPSQCLANTSHPEECPCICICICTCISICICICLKICSNRNVSMSQCLANTIHPEEWPENVFLVRLFPIISPNLIISPHLIKAANIPPSFHHFTQSNQTDQSDIIYPSIIALNLIKLMKVITFDH